MLPRLEFAEAAKASKVLADVPGRLLFLFLCSIWGVAVDNYGYRQGSGASEAADVDKLIGEESANREGRIRVAKVRERGQLAVLLLLQVLREGRSAAR